MNPACPYVGLQPFEEGDALYFFGRERDVRVIAANLLSQRLTVLYGPSGVGKSSVLRAGVVRHLRTLTDSAVVYFNSWQSETFSKDLATVCREALGVPSVEGELERIVNASGRRLFLLLDQFEELLLYHQHGRGADAFDSMLARLVNREDLTVNLLIGIRDDGLSRFDQRFAIRIADLLGNTIPLDHLSYEAGKRAVLAPIDVFNERAGLVANGYTIENELVDEVLRQVRVRRFAEAEAGDRDIDAAEQSHIEAPYLQLVLRRLWDEEIAQNSQDLRATTLEAIGGAPGVVDQHVNRVLSGLPRDRDREIAAAMFRFLVTKSRSKIAQRTNDLIDYADAPDQEVRDVLVWLSTKPESRILRRFDSPERYELFHDVLAQPVLDWRRHLVSEREAEEKDRERRNQAARARQEVRRLRWILAGMALLVVVAGGLAWYAFDQRRRLQEYAGLVREAATSAVEATNVAQGERERARAAEATAQARAAELAGQTKLAAQLRQTAEDARQQAFDSDRKAVEAKDMLNLAGEGRDSPREQQIADLQRDRDQLEQRVKVLTDEKTGLEREREKLRSEFAGVTAEIKEVPKILEQLKIAVDERNALRSTLDAQPPVPGADLALKGNYRDIYERAMTFKSRRQWGEAARFFEAAARLRGDTGEPIPRQDQGTEPYLPNYQLGLVRRELACEAWERSVKDGAIQKLKDSQTFLEQRKICEAR